MMIKPYFCIPVIGLLLFFLPAVAQDNTYGPGHIYYNNIRSVKLNQSGDQTAFPVISLNGGDAVDLSFDDLDADVKDYYYTLQLCNYDWTPVNINQLEYLRGFSENRITTYKFSSVALVRYTHYTVSLPNGNCMPIKAGNYLLKVYLDSDTSQLAFTKRLMVVSNKGGLSGVIQQPVSPKVFKTNQKVNFVVSTGGLNVVNPFDQLKVVILQNYRWDFPIINPKPMFIKGNTIEYNAELDVQFPAGKEWRWIDLRSFRLQTERVKRSEYHKDGTDVYVMPDYPRGNTMYSYVKDYNGMYFLATIDNYDPFYEGDYATAHFTYPAPEPYAGYDLYLIGEMTNYEYNDGSKMVYNPQTRAYEGTMFLKQGFYNYEYALLDTRDPDARPSTADTEGDWWETENNYTILLYYRDLGGRYDELVSTVTLNSRLNR